MITLAIIAKYNVEQFRHLVYTALSHVEEIVVAVDDDCEKGIDGYYGIYVDYYQHSLEHNFAAQRNFLCDKATQPWILHLDTDEDLTPWMWDHLQEIVTETEEQLILLPRVNRISGCDQLFSWPDWQPKLHTANVRWQYAIHEWPVGFVGTRYLPEETQYAIQHTKDGAMQERSNTFFATFL